MNDILFPAVTAALMLLAAFAGVVQWLKHSARVRTERLRAEGYRLIHALGAYSAWMDLQRDLPFTAKSLDELNSPAPLTRARQIKHQYFPELSSHMIRLLQAHSRVMEYLWQQNLMRLTQGAGWRPAREDAPYQQLRGAQEELIDEMVARCRELIGDAREQWRATGSDFSFSTGLALPGTGPAPN
ncbi:MAG: hypothetical protein V4787_07805 [Pseudomonadota bacterium]